VTNSQFLTCSRDRLAILYPLNNQLLEIGRERLLRYLLHLPSSNLKVILTSPLEEKIAREAHFLVKTDCLLHLRSVQGASQLA